MATSSIDTNFNYSDPNSRSLVIIYAIWYCVARNANIQELRFGTFVNASVYCKIFKCNFPYPEHIHSEKKKNWRANRSPIFIQKSNVKTIKFREQSNNGIKCETVINMRDV